MKYFVVFVLALLNVAVKSEVANVGKFFWENCDASYEIQTISFSMLPDPVVIPGQLTISLELLGSLPVDKGTPANFTFSYRADATQPWEAFPCHFGLIDIGSCYYPDVCVIFDFFNPPADPCPPQYGTQPCRCPFPADVPYSFTNTFQIDTSSGLFKSGDYDMIFYLYQDDVDFKPIFCNTVQFTLQFQ